jgi:hypothetical protein
MFGTSRIASETHDLAHQASRTADEALNAIRAHATFCVEREAKRDQEHSSNLNALTAIGSRMSHMSWWIIGMVIAFLAYTVTQLLLVMGYLIVHYVLKG